jgi:hypothetical protein
MEMRSAWSNGGSDAHGEHGMPWHDFHESEIDHFYANSGLASPQNAASLGSTKGKAFKGGMKPSGKGSKGKAKGKFSSCITSWNSVSRF